MPGGAVGTGGEAPRAVELFTHPQCSGCGEAIGALSELERAGKIALKVSSLGVPSVRLRAEELGVTSVPTVRLEDDYRVLLRESDLTELVADWEPESPEVDAMIARLSEELAR